MKKRIFKNMEWGILICTILLILIGLVALFSATQNTQYDEFRKQIIWLCISIPIFIVILFIDYEIVAKAAPVFYGIILILLVGVLFTEPVNGAKSWFGVGMLSFQPSEQPLVLQIGGSTPQIMAEDIKIAEDYGYKEVNINAGCPSERVQAGAFEN